MRITLNELKKLEELNKPISSFGFRKRKGRYFMRKATSTKLNFDNICNNLDYLEKKTNATNSSFLKFKYTMATKVLLDLLEEGKYGKEKNQQ